MTLGGGNVMVSVLPSWPEAIWTQAGIWDGKKARPSAVVGPKRWFEPKSI